MKKFKGLLLTLMLTGVLLLGACTTTSDAPKKENYDEPSSSTQSETKEETFGLKETAVFDNLKITVTEVKESKGANYFEPEDGNVFIGVNFTIENISDESESISSLLMFDSYVDDVNAELSISGTCAFDSNTVDGELAPGKKLVGWYVVEASKDWSEIEVIVKPDLLSNSSATFTYSK